MNKSTKIRLSFVFLKNVFSCKALGVVKHTKKKCGRILKKTVSVVCPTSSFKFKGQVENCIYSIVTKAGFCLVSVQTIHSPQAWICVGFFFLNIAASTVGIFTTNNIQLICFYCLL